MSSLIDLSQLPPPEIVEALDFEALLSARKAAFLEHCPPELQADISTTLTLESEPIVGLLQESSYRELILRERINEAACAVMLAFSRGQDLDHLVALFNVKRFVLHPGDAQAIPPVPPTLESDSALRLRAQQAFEGRSVAGPRNAYIYHALSADARVADISAESPAPAEVVVSVLARAGDGSAPADLLARVTAALNDENIRPLGDRVTVQGAQIMPYSVDAQLYLYPGPEAEPIYAAALAKLNTYTAAQRRLGRDIRRSALFAALHVEGVQRVELLQPVADMVLSKHQASYCEAVQLNIGGTDE